MRSPDMPGNASTLVISKHKPCQTLISLHLKTVYPPNKFETRVSSSAEAKASSRQIYGAIDYFFLAIRCLP
jgi:hypothetical protein